jgi:multisubunit Na+/H+ antiporter MnhE subunit
MTTTAERVRHSETNALAASGVLLMLIGGTWWAFDADPSLGRDLLGLGVAVLTAGLVLRGYLGTTGRKLAMVIAALVFALAAFELWQAIVTIADQRRATLS